MTELEIATIICQRVAELPDRTSPSDWPEAMLVTTEELLEVCQDALTGVGQLHGREESVAFREEAIRIVSTTMADMGYSADDIASFKALPSGHDEMTVQAVEKGLRMHVGDVR